MGVVVYLTQKYKISLNTINKISQQVGLASLVLKKMRFMNKGLGLKKYLRADCNGRIIQFSYGKCGCCNGGDDGVRLPGVVCIVGKEYTKPYL